MKKVAYREIVDGREKLEMMVDRKNKNGLNFHPNRSYNF